MKRSRRNSWAAYTLWSVLLLLLVGAGGIVLKVCGNNHKGPSIPSAEVKLGDLAYWPEGHALCIFFGPTPMSTGTAIIPAAPVTVVGKIQCKPNSFPHLRNYIIKIDKDLTI